MNAFVVFQTFQGGTNESLVPIDVIFCLLLKFEFFVGTVAAHSRDRCNADQPNDKHQEWCEKRELKGVRPETRFYLRLSAQNVSN